MTGGELGEHIANLQEQLSQIETPGGRFLACVLSRTGVMLLYKQKAFGCRSQEYLWLA